MSSNACEKLHCHTRLKQTQILSYKTV